jgi:hypothetical protein
MGLWKKFKHHIQVYASVDHYGERAEYIRHGTNWADIEYNFVMAKKSPFIKLQMNTVLSLYNYKTFLEFYQYLFDKDLYPVTAHFSIYNMSSPEYLTSNVLPQHYKDEGRLKLLSLLDIMREREFSANSPSITAVNSIIDWTMAPSENTWEKYKEEFRTTTALRDSIRGESFVKTFPELADLMDDAV